MYPAHQAAPYPTQGMPQPQTGYQAYPMPQAQIQPQPGGHTYPMPQPQAQPTAAG